MGTQNCKAEFLLSWKSYRGNKKLTCEPQPNDLALSGADPVLAHTMYAIVGAIALERGGLEANKFARERILDPQNW